MSKVDLNLLVVFDAIIEEGSITLAASRVGMTQPAVSNAVARMRLVWNDPLFVKQGRGIRPTPRAIVLWQKFRTPLLEIREMNTQNHFDPASSERVFRIGITEHPADMLWLPLRQLMEVKAPNICIHSVPIHRNTEELLLDASIDLAVHYYVGNYKNINATWLFNNKLVCVVRPGHRLLKLLDSKGVLPLAQYLLEDHLMVSLSGEARANVDDVLESMGVKRKIAMAVNHFSLVASMLQQSDLVCVTPQSVVASAVSAKTLVVVPLSFDIDPAPISMLWHSRQDRDPGNIWIRQLISKSIDNEVVKIATSFNKIN
ncbi:Transcriptional regulator, LysR family [Moritella sp. JT01]|uniref:LysR family transcriptional regulator n=1 Tax=Moritella sp. JT01 TaxID=756698 RepID=UPI000795A51A|nr:LysR family transcriptional regulator [Moritella sp. JT01]KXO13228.1 Transcriptional regulator, LysR family [Moritella sp. JT01]